MLNDFTLNNKKIGDLLPDNRISITLLRNTEAPLANNYAVIPLNRVTGSPIKPVSAQNNRSIWEIDGRLRCPVIGNCLSFPEQKKILKKANMSYKNLSDFEIHTTLTQGISEKSPFSIRVQQFLDKKYKGDMTRIGVCSEQRFFFLWKKAITKGEIDGLLWIAVIKISLSEAGINRLFGDIHMLMHEQGSIVKRGLLQVKSLRKENSNLKDKLQSIQKEAQGSSYNLALLSRELAAAEKNIKIMVEDNRKLKDKKADHDESHLKKENEKQHIKLEKQKQKIQTQEHTINSTVIINKKLKSELKLLKNSIHLTYKGLDPRSKETFHAEPDCVNCAADNLCSRKVLLVGGLTRLRPFYQKIVESTGGEFKHHDGHNGGSKHRLESWVDWADIVLCPVDVNSHSACLNVKRTCKKLEKTYQMLSSSSVSSISRALETETKNT